MATSNRKGNLDHSLIERLRKLDTCVVSDALDQLKLQQFRGYPPETG
jgi:hypothetical protein